MKPDEFVTADTHFGHKNIVRLASRPFESIEEMNRELILLWNAKVPKNAVVYHLGDFALARRTLALEVLAQLNGRIRLVGATMIRSSRERSSSTSTGSSAATRARPRTGSGSS